MPLGQDQAVRGGSRWGKVSLEVKVKVSQPKEAQRLPVEVDKRQNLLNKTRRTMTLKNTKTMTLKNTKDNDS